MSVVARIEALKDYDLESLRVEWKRLFGREAPGYGREHLRARLAYRIQELEFGGLTEDAKHRLAAINKAKAEEPVSREGIPVTGTVLVREYRGIKHEVRVLSKGFSYGDRSFKSLSQIAKAITGTTINGKAFFGLKPKPRTGAKP